MGGLNSYKFSFYKENYRIFCKRALYTVLLIIRLIIILSDAVHIVSAISVIADNLGYYLKNLNRYIQYISLRKNNQRQQGQRDNNGAVRKSVSNEAYSDIPTLVRSHCHPRMVF